MFSLDYDGDGNPDGDTPDYKVFADSPEIEIGHLGEPGGGGEGEPTILLVQDNTSAGSNDSLQHVQAFQSDLDAIDPAYTSEWYSLQQIDASERTIIMDYVQNYGGNVILPSQVPYNGYAGYPAWHYFMGAPWSSGYLYVTYMNVSGMPMGTGPGGMIATINRVSAGQDHQEQGRINQPNVTTIGMYSSASTAISRDHDTGSVGGRMTTIGTVWHYFSTTSPAAPGRSGLLHNLLNWIDPQILIVESGGPGGEDPILPWDGPVDIADMFAWLYAEDGSAIDGGDGDAPADQVEIWVLLPTDPQSVWFECLARSAGAPDSLIYEWEFVPGDGFSIWTRYTAHWYDGGVDPDDEGPLEPGDEFDVWCRVYDSDVAPSYALAPPDSRDIDSVRIRVHGPPAIDIRDDGTVIDDKYEPDEFTGDVTVALDFWVEGGVPPYDNVYIDYDYDFVTFDEPPAAGTVEVTPTPGEGHTDYDLVIPDPNDGDIFYIAIRAYDTEAPNDYDTYAWMDPINVVIGGGIAVINDGGTANKNAIIADLNALGLAYQEIPSSSISSGSDLEGFVLTIWCPYNGYNYISTTEQQYMMDYIDAGGNVFLPYSRMDSTGTTFKQYNGSNYIYTWFGTQFVCTSPSRIIHSGPGGTINYVYCSYQTFSDIYVSYMLPNTAIVADEYGYVGSYIDGLVRDNLPSDDDMGKCGWFCNWEMITGTSPGGPGRSGVLANIIDYYLPDMI